MNPNKGAADSMNTEAKRTWKGAVPMVAALLMGLTCVAADARFVRGSPSMEWSRTTAQHVERMDRARAAHFHRGTRWMERCPRTAKYLVAGGTALAAYYPSRDHIWGPVQAEASGGRSPSNPLHRVYNGLEWGVMLLILGAGGYLFLRFRRPAQR